MAAKTKHDRTKELSDKALAKLAKIVHERRGGLTELAQRVSKRAGYEVQRQHIATWLDVDVDERSQPRLGMGLLLIQIGEEMAAEEANR